MGYGSRAVQALNSFYSGEYFNLDESNKAEASYPDVAAIDPVRSPFVFYGFQHNLTHICTCSRNRY